MRQLRKDWDIVDEGPMEDLLGIECNTNQARAGGAQKLRDQLLEINRLRPPPRGQGVRGGRA